MDSPASRLDPNHLRQEAARLRTIAFYVSDRQFAKRLEDEAADLLAKAAAMTVVPL